LTWDALRSQETVGDDGTLAIDDTHCLAGSAEQGILEYFAGTKGVPCKLYAENSCFRVEEDYEGLIRCKEFRKLEQFAFCSPNRWKETFGDLLNTAMTFLMQYDIEFRLRDCTEEDPGYHHHKVDIEVKTEQYGWMETHSCSYFADEQVKRFGITGGCHTISNTGIASPRILIPFIEQGLVPKVY
jgi:seryl-tRNA synthetase